MIAQSLRLFFGCVCVGNIGESQNLWDDSIKVHIDTVEVSQELPGSRLATTAYTAHDIQRAPGSLGDPMRVLASSADVVANSDIQAIPIIGGDEADGILTLLDGFPIGFPYRLLGGFSLLNPLTTSAIDLLNMGYPVCYGGFAPTAISIRSRSEYDTHPKVQVDLGLPLSSSYIHLPLSDSLQWSAKIAFRASHVGVAADMLSGSNRDRLRSFLPNLKDVQIFLREMPSINLYMFQEGLMSEERGSLKSLDRTFDYSWQKGFAGAGFLTSSDRLSSEHRISWARDNVTLSTFVPIEYIGTKQFLIDCRFTSFRWRSQFDILLLPTLRLNAGSEVLYGIADIQFRTFSSWLNNKSPLHSSFTDASFFSDIQWHPNDYISGTLGVRSTYFGFIEQAGIEPRGSINIKLDNRSELKLAAGTYLQSPSDNQILHGFLTFLAMPGQTPRMMLMSENRKTLKLQTHNLITADATSFLLQERQVYLDIRFHVYYKETESLILPARYPNIFTPLDSMSFVPLQYFQAVKSGTGISSLIRIIPLELALTASVFTHRSRIEDNRTKKEYRTVGDIPTVVKIFAQFHPESWDMSMLYQYSTGVPTTEQYYLRSTNIFGDVFFIPVWKELNSTRVPDYRRLDINITKTWSGAQWKIALSLNILNILSEENISDYIYEFSEQQTDYVKKKPVTNTLPFVPNIGLQCEYIW